MSVLFSHAGAVAAFSVAKTAFYLLGLVCLASTATDSRGWKRWLAVLLLVGLIVLDSLVWGGATYLVDHADTFCTVRS